jgi:hypothetical protein
MGAESYVVEKRVFFGSYSEQGLKPGMFSIQFP